MKLKCVQIDCRLRNEEERRVSSAGERKKALYRGSSRLLLMLTQACFSLPCSIEGQQDRETGR